MSKKTKTKKSVLLGGCCGGYKSLVLAFSGQTGVEHVGMAATTCSSVVML